MVYLTNQTFCQRKRSLNAVAAGAIVFLALAAIASSAPPTETVLKRANDLKQRAQSAVKAGAQKSRIARDREPAGL